MPRIKLLVKKFSYRQLKEVCNDENWKIPTLADVREKEIDSEPFWIKDLPESQDQLTHSLAYNPKVGNIMLVNKNNLMSSVVLVEEVFCKWKSDGEFNTYKTSCGNVFQLTEGSLDDNKIIFCCYCGRTIDEEK